MNFRGVALAAAFLSSAMSVAGEPPQAQEALSDELERESREAWQLCQNLGGYESLRKSFEIERAMVGSINQFPESLHVDLRTTNRGLINAVWWWDPLRNGEPLYDWTSLEALYQRASKVIATHTWLAEWRNTSPGRLVELHAFGEGVGATEFDLQHFVLPVWQQAGFPGEPTFAVLARRDDDSWAQLYFSDQDPRALVTSVSEPDAKAGHWLDGLEVYFHPRCKPDEDSERYVVVGPAGNWEIREFAGCEP
jgi:hypothetical protein